MKNHRLWRATAGAVLCAFLLASSVGCARPGAKKPDALPAAAGPVPQVRLEPAEAKKLLLGMAELLAKAPQFSVDVQSGYDVVQASGEKIEFGEHRHVVLSRPGRLRVEVEQSDGDRHRVLFDGRTVTAFSPARNAYAQVEKPGTIDDAVTYFVKDLGMRLPLAMLLVTRLPGELERRTQSLAYVEKTSLYGVPAHHLAGRTQTVDYQVWIADAAQPLPLKVVLTYRDADGQPQYRARLSDWNFAPAITDALFAFTPPAGANRIPFLAQLPRPEKQGQENSPQIGEPK